MYLLYNIIPILHPVWLDSCSMQNGSHGRQDLIKLACLSQYFFSSVFVTFSFLNCDWPIERLTLRERSMENKTFYVDGLADH